MRPGGGLVHEQHLGLAHQQAGQQQLAPLEGLEARRRPVVGNREVHRFGAIFRVEARKPGAEGLARGLEGLANSQIFGHQRRLIGAPDADARPLEQRQARDVLALKGHLAGLGLIAAGQDLETGWSCRRRSGR